MSSIVSNNAVTKLVGALSSSTGVGGTFSVTGGDGAKFPSTSGGNTFNVTLSNSSGAREIITISNRSTDTFTIAARAAETIAGVAGVAQNWSVGDSVSCNITAAAFNAKVEVADATTIANTAAAGVQTNLNTHTASTTAHTATNLVNTPSGGVTSTTVQAAINELDTKKLASTAAASTYAPISNPNLTGTPQANSLEIGFRKVPQNAQVTTYTLQASDVGKHVLTSSGVTLPSTGFVAGDIATVVNSGSSAITFTTTGNTVYKAGSSSAWASGGTLAAKGLATFLCIQASPSIWIVSGAGLT